MTKVGNDLRLVTVHDPATALPEQRKRKATMARLEARANDWAGKPGDQDLGKKKRGCMRSNSGTKARLRQAAREAHLDNLIKLAMKAELFSCAIDG